MDCENLAVTGADPANLLLAGAVILVAGILLVVLTRSRRRARTVAVAIVMLTLGASFLPIGSPAARAASVDCAVDGDHADSLTIAQTSILNGLAPNVAPAAIAGRVTNNSLDDTYIHEVVVSILAVSKSADATAGTCDASDYILVAPVMPVGEELAGGASTTFAGASVGFADKATNQDACQGATLTLLYTTG